MRKFEGYIANGRLAMWQAVQANADRQRQEYAAKAALGPAPIEEYFPELHGTTIQGLFTNTSGSHLIGDLLTSPCVIVDLYDFNSEDGLIKKYGIDKDFLLKLRDLNLVVIAANLEEDRYQDCGWMHDLLADPRTIFRPARTPQYFSSLSPDVVALQKELRDRIIFRTQRLAARDFDRFASAILIQGETIDSFAIANKLAWDLVRLDSVLGVDEGAADKDEFLSGLFADPEESLNIIARDKFIAVSPLSGGLGGDVRITYERMTKLFPHASNADKIFSEVTTHHALRDYLSKVQLKVHPVDVSSEHYWRGLSRYHRDALLAQLANKSDRTKLKVIENNLRIRMASTDTNFTMEEVEDLVAKDIKLVERVEGIASVGYNATNAAFAMFLGQRFGYVTGVAGFALGRIGQSKIKSVLEYAIPRLQVVNFVKRKAG